MQNKINRRKALKILSATGIATVITGTVQAESKIKSCDGDGTPLQFIPKTTPDEKPLENELTKYSKCPYCGMDRTKWNHSRHLIHYSDNLVDATCSLHCATLSLAINLDRVPKAIYAADFGSNDKIKPLINVDKATYLIGSDLKGTMTKISKMAFSSADVAKAVQAKHGGKTATFDETLKISYANIAENTLMIRKNRAEKRKHKMMHH
jgi:nitrous oxide reductase accessory protein NosL